MTEVHEGKRGLLRVGTNYGSLLAMVVIGIAIIPMMIRWLGADAAGVFMLLLGQTGLADIFRDVVQQSLTRELAAAWHRKTDFRKAIDAAIVVCAGVAAAAVVMFGILVLVLPFMRIPETLLDAARWVVALECAFAIVKVLTLPALTMLAVREEFVTLNITLVLRRCDVLLALIVARSIWPNPDPGFGFVVMMVMAISFRSLVVIVTAAWMIARDRRLIPRPWKATSAAMRPILGTFGWNSGVVLANSLHDRSGGFIIAVSFGSYGNVVFGAANRLLSYIRRATMGMTLGIDAVGARLASRQDGGDGIRRMLRAVTRSHGLAAWPAAVIAFVLSDELIRLWLARALEDPDKYIDVMSMLVRVGTLGLAARAISDGWIFLIYGAGHVRRYAKILLIGGITNPILAILLIVLLPDMGTTGSPWSSITGVSWAITIAFVLFNGILLPIRAASILSVPVTDFWGPLLRPFVVAVVLGPVLLVPEWLPMFRQPGEAWGLFDLGLSVVLYGCAYAVLAYFLLATQEERASVHRHLVARLPIIGSGPSEED